MKRLIRVGYACVAKLVLLTVLGFAVWSTSLPAQSSYGSIVGIITDASGAAVPNALVTLTNSATDEKKTIKTDGNGSFRFAELPPSTYSVSVIAVGFKTVDRSAVPVQVADTVRIDTTLQVGATSDTVTVTSELPVLQTDSGTLSSQVEGERVQQLPLNGRNPMNLIALVAGVVPQGTTSGSAAFNQGNHTNNAGWGNYQIGGGTAGQSAEYVDGATVDVYGNTVALIPTQDVVQEFKVSTNAVTADFGRFAGGVVEMTTKSGGNGFHGTVYEYVRNNVFNANSFFSKNAGLGRPKFDQNQYGFEVGGPIKKDKAFFMANYERFSARIGLPTTSGTPTYNQEQGIFTGKISDPTGNCAIAYNAVTNQSTIPATCFDTTAVSLFGLFPTPNAATPDASTFFTNAAGGNDTYQVTGRVDYNPTAHQRIFGRYTYWNVLDSSIKPYGVTPIDSGDAFSKSLTHQVVLGDTYTINPTTILDVRLSYLRQFYANVPPTLGIDGSQFGSGWTALNAQQSYHTIPLVHILGPDNIQGFFGPGINAADTFNNYVLGASVLKVLGKHTIKVGGELRSMQRGGASNNHIDEGGSFNFLPFVTGNEFAGFLLGEYQTASISTVKSITTFNNPQAYYITDTWQATSNLTLNLGLRWEMPGGVSEKKDRSTVLLPKTVDPVTGHNGAVVLVDSALYGSRSAVQIKHDLFAPRVSFAYRLGSKATLNGGYGLAYLPPDLSPGANTSASPVNSATTTETNTVYHGLQNPFGVLTGSTLLQPVGRNPEFITGFAGQVVTSPIPTSNFPYAQQWNLTVGEEVLPDLSMEVSYVGAKGTHLPSIGTGTGYYGINQLSSSYYAQLQNMENNGASTAEIVATGQALRPYPYFQDLQNSIPYVASNTYEALQVKSQKRFKNGSVLAGNYTWSKIITDTDTLSNYLEPNAGASINGSVGVVQDFNNPRGERAVSGYNTPNRAVINYVLNLPFGRGQSYVSGVQGITDKFVSGWAVNGITTFQSGFPLGLYEDNGNNLSVHFGAGYIRPNYTAGCQKTVEGSAYSRVKSGNWFNASCFTYPGDFAFGNQPRNDSALRAQGTDNFDFSVLKSTKFGERLDLQFRAELFNLFNHTQFAPPGVAIGGSYYNQVSSQANQPRLGQFSLRLNF